MSEVSLTGADLFDLAAGFSFNTLDGDGDEVVLYGEDFSDDDVATLVAGETVEYEDGYTISAPEEPWGGHHSSEEVAEVYQGRYGPRLRHATTFYGRARDDGAPGEPPGPRGRLSDLAERLTG